MGLSYYLANSTKKEYISFKGIWADTQDDVVTGGQAPELMLTAQNMLLWKESMNDQRWFVDEWNTLKGLPDEFQEAMRKISGRWAGHKIYFVSSFEHEFAEHGGRECVASVKARCEQELESTCEVTRMFAETRIAGLKECPEEGWFDISCDVLLGAAAFRIAKEPNVRNPFSLVGRRHVNDRRLDSYGLAHRVEALRQMATLAEAQDKKVKAARAAREAESKERMAIVEKRVATKKKRKLDAKNPKNAKRTKE